MIALGKINDKSERTRRKNICVETCPSNGSYSAGEYTTELVAASMWRESSLVSGEERIEAGEAGHIRTDLPSV